MILYNYSDDGIFAYSEDAPLDPLKNKIHPDTGPHYLIPANSTTVPPPVIPAGQQARWTGQKWTLEDIPAPEPGIEDYLLDLDFRISLIELGVI